MKDDLYTRLVALQHPILHCTDAEKKYCLAEYECAHNLGRWWEATLTMENTTGMKIDNEMYRQMHHLLIGLTSNPYGMLLNDPEVFPDHESLPGGYLNYHNLREALLAYTAFIEYRDSLWARHRAEALLDTIDRRFFLKTLTDEELSSAIGLKVAVDTMITRPDWDIYRDVDDTPTTGRAIEGMYRYWKLTNSPRALALMHKAVAFHRETAICADGSTPDWMKDTKHTGHNHSYLGTLRGLLLYALEFDDKELIKSIYLTYKNSIPKYNCDATGFAPHDLALARFPDANGDPIGDHASCTDTLYIAFLLAVRAGYTELLDDVERFMRGRLFYTQNTDEWNYGSWGIYCGYFSKASAIDVWCLIATTFSYIWKEMIEERNDATYIHLLFTGKTNSVSVVSERDDNKHNITITPNCKKKILVRIPAWVPENSLCVTDSEKKDLCFKREGVYLAIDSESITEGTDICISFDLPKYQTSSKTWVSNKEFILSWSGDRLDNVTEVQ